MACTSAVKLYVNKMLNDIAGMKVLLLDPTTTGIVSVVESQTNILQKDVFLISQLARDKRSREQMRHLNAVVFVQPTPDNIWQLHKELEDPCYGEYHIFFTNTVQDRFLEELAEADEFEVVKQVQEFYGDYYAIDGDVYSLHTPTRYTDAGLEPAVADRCIDGLVSVLLSLKKRPQIRYTRSSGMTRRLADMIGARLTEDPTTKQLFDFPSEERSQSAPPVLLVLDRRASWPPPCRRPRVAILESPSVR